MGLAIEAACGCSMGKVRKNNEDNFFFDGKCMEQDNTGLSNVACFEGRLKSGTTVAVFDGMGGENYGEAASFAAARRMQLLTKGARGSTVHKRKYLQKTALGLNDAVVQTKREYCTNRMGTTMVMLYFAFRHIYVCNVGDSRAYRLRKRDFLQVSEDHTEKIPGKKKTPLTQHLGIDPEDMLVEPYIAKSNLKQGDIYLICSDGLTDMLTDSEISDILLSGDDAASCTDKLISSALANGGRDNVTVIVCKII